MCIGIPTDLYVCICMYIHNEREGEGIAVDFLPGLQQLLASLLADLQVPNMTDPANVTCSPR